MTDAHVQTQHFTIVTAYPDHTPREDDPHYSVFHRARRRLEALGQLQCWVNNADCDHEPIQLHHAAIEFALANDVDWQKYSDLNDLHLKTNDEFLDLINAEGSLTALCRTHHIGAVGIHVLPYPLFSVQRYLKAGIAAPARAMPS